MNYKQIGALVLAILLCGTSIIFLRVSNDNTLPTIKVDNNKPIIACDTKFEDLLSYASASDDKAISEFFIEENSLVDVVNNHKLTYVAIDNSGNVKKEVIYVDVDNKVSDKRINVIKELEVEFRHDFVISDYFIVKNGCGWEFDANLEVSGMDLNKVGEYDIVVKALKDSSIPILNTKLNVKDFESPIITLKYNKLILEYEESYDYKRLIDKLEDNKDDYDYLLENIKIESNVNNQNPGTYEVKYIVTDSDGKSSSITIPVTVKAKPQETYKPEWEDNSSHNDGGHSEPNNESNNDSNDSGNDNHQEETLPTPDTNHQETPPDTNNSDNNQSGEENTNPENNNPNTEENNGDINEPLPSDKPVTSPEVIE